jgi:hypothetical protein
MNFKDIVNSNSENKVIKSVQFILIKTIKNYLFCKIVSIDCHFENAYFTLNHVNIGLKEIGINT